MPQMEQGINWTTIIVSLIAGIPGAIVAIGALLASLRNTRKIDQNTAITKHVPEAVALAVTEAVKNGISTKIADVLVPKIADVLVPKIADVLVPKIVEGMSQEDLIRLVAINTERITRHAKANAENVDHLMKKLDKIEADKAGKITESKG